MAAKLYYFDGRGKAELVRIVLAAAGVQFTEEFLKEKDQWEELKKGGKLLYKQVPLLEIDGLKLVQTGAIARYIARKHDLYGTNNVESTIIDMYFEGTRDFYNNSFLSLGFKDDTEVLKNTKDVMIPKYLPVYEKIFSSGGKFLTGDTLSLADLGLLEALLAVEEFIGNNTFDTYPNLKVYYENLKSFDNIAAFLSGPQRKKKNDETYVSTVKNLLYS